MNIPFTPRPNEISPMSASTPMTASPMPPMGSYRAPSAPGGTLSQRNNNPGNLIYAGQPGASQGDRRPDGTYWAKFPDATTGMAAFQNDNAAKIRRSPGMTLAQLIDMRSPPSENSPRSLHYNVVDDLKDLRDKGLLKSLLANQITAAHVPPDRLAHALAKAEGYFNSASPQIKSTSGLTLDLSKIQ